MLDIGWQELFIVAILAILVVGPKDLPRALKTVMQYVRKARGLAREFQNGVDEMVREADLDDLKKDLTKIGRSGGLENTIKEAVDPTGELTKEMDMTEAQRDLEKTAKDAVKETDAEAGKEPESIANSPQTPDASENNGDNATVTPVEEPAPPAGQTVTTDTKSDAAKSSTPS